MTINVIYLLRFFLGAPYERNVNNFRELKTDEDENVWQINCTR
jgi:hypothetical protein